MTRDRQRDYDEHAERVVIPSLRREMQVVKDVIDEYKLDMPENRRLHRALGIEIRTGASGNQWFYRVGPGELRVQFAGCLD